MRQSVPALVKNDRGNIPKGLARKACTTGLRLRSALQPRELSGVETRCTGILFICKSLTRNIALWILFSNIVPYGSD
jgi:hypothetical protein